MLVIREVQCVQHGRLSCSDQGDIMEAVFFDSLEFTFALVDFHVVNNVAWVGTRDLLA